VGPDVQHGWKYTQLKNVTLTFDLLTQPNCKIHSQTMTGSVQIPVALARRAVHIKAADTSECLTRLVFKVTSKLKVI